MGFEMWRCLAGLSQRDGGAIFQTQRRAEELGTFEPFADGFFGDAKRGGCGAQGGAISVVMANHFSSHERSQCGISVHSVRAGWLGVESVTTTSLPNPRSADNVLKHDT